MKKKQKIGTPKMITIIVLKIEQFWFYNAAMHPKDADGMASRIDHDQTAPCRSSLIWVYTVYLELSVPILRIFVVHK